MILNTPSIILASLLAVTAITSHAAPAERTASGLIYESLKDGSGEQPNAQSSVQVHYRGRPIRVSAVDPDALQRYARFGWLAGGPENWEPVEAFLAQFRAR